MAIARIIISNFKSIKKCDISVDELNVLIGENGTGKTTVLEAINYFYSNMISNSYYSENIFDENNKYSNEINISIYYDLDEFVKIAKSHTSLDPFDDFDIIDYSNYYHKILSIDKSKTDKYFVVTLKQIKGKQITWNKSYEDRFILKSLFPVFFVKARELDVFNWNYIWEIIGDLVKVSNDEREKIHYQIKAVLDNKGNKTSTKISHISEIFQDSKFGISPTTSKTFASFLVKIYFGGNEIQYKERRMSFFSTGTNAVHYLELLISLIHQLSKDKLKHPFFMIDEPELNLHHSYIDILTESISKTYDSVQYLISTHSSRLTKNIIKSLNTSKIYKVSYKNRYTYLNPIRLFSFNEPKSVYKVTDDHANAYFSKMILFVEGETELELFSNPYLKAIYRNLKYVDVFKAMSDGIIRDIMLPSKINTKIPYRILIDMDKVFFYDKKENLFKLGDHFKGMPNQKKEQYLFHNYIINNPTLYSQHQRIIAMCNKCKFHYYHPFYSCRDDNFYQFIKCIKKYFSHYDTFVCKTTIEGVLINEQTLDIALDYLKTKKNPNTHKKFKDYIDTLYKNDKINVLRLVFNGKTDFLLTLKNLNGKIPQDKLKLIQDVNIGRKADGWVTDFLEFFFKEIGITNPNSIDSNNKLQILRKFEVHFSELSGWLKDIEKCINNIQH